MEKLVLVGSEPLRLALPTPQEIEVVDHFTRRSEELEIMQRLVSKWYARVVNDIKATSSAIVDIFDKLNSSLEIILSSNISEFSPWSLNSSQPRFLARSVGCIASLDNFIENMFGSSKKISEIDVDGKLSDISSFFDFFLVRFLDEVKLVREIEIAPSLKSIGDGTQFGFSANYAESKFTHTFIWETSTIKASQFRVQINEGKLFEFSESVKSTSKGILSSVTSSALEKIRDRNNVLNLDYISRDMYLKNARKFYAPLFERISFELFDKNRITIEKKFPNNFDLSDHAGFNSIEESFFNAIIRNSLSNFSTDGNSAEFSDEAMGKGVGNAGARLSFAAKLSVIDAYAAENPGAQVSSKILEIFPELESLQQVARVSAPSEPPAIWPEDRIAIKGVLETPPDFIKRHYSEWLGNGLTRADIRRLDKPLSTALDNWLRRNPMPDDFDLPTLKEQNSRWVERIEREGFGTVVSGNVAGGSAKEVLKEAQRLRAAQYRHRHSDR